MKSLLFSLFILCSASALSAYPYHAQNLAMPLKYIYAFDGTRKLMAEAEKEGPITIKTAPLGTEASNAAWMGGERTIYLNFSNPRSLGSQITSIVFEMHNALSEKKFSELDRKAATGRLSRAQYIQAVEQVEYANALKTSKLLQQGVCKGIFPPDAQFSVAPNFDEHYRIQIYAGHSALIGYTYDDIVKSNSRALARNR